MKTIGRKRMRNSFAAAILTAALGMSTAVGTLVLVGTPAFAQTTLSTLQISVIRASLTTSLLAAHGDSASIEHAISQAVQNAIAQYGGDAAASITSAIMSMAEQAGVPADVIGRALAQAAAAVSVTNSAAASAIALTVANEGNAEEIVAFQTMATSLGYSNLASIAGSGAKPTGETGEGEGGGGGGGCLNPSCTAL